MKDSLAKNFELKIFEKLKNNAGKFNKKKFQTDHLGEKILSNCLISPDTAIKLKESTKKLTKTRKSFDDPKHEVVAQEFHEYISSNGYPTPEELLDIQSKEPEAIHDPNIISKFYKETYDKSEIIEAYLDKTSDLKKVLEDASEILSRHRKDIEKISDFILKAKKNYEEGCTREPQVLAKFFPLEFQEENLKILRLSMLEPLDVLNSTDEELKTIINSVSKKRDDFINAQKKIAETQKEEYLLKQTARHQIQTLIEGENFSKLSKFFSSPSKEIFQDLFKKYVILKMKVGHYVLAPSGSPLYEKQVEKTDQYKKEALKIEQDFRLKLRDPKSEQTVIEEYKNLKQEMDTLIKKEQNLEIKKHLEYINNSLFFSDSALGDSAVYEKFYNLQNTLGQKRSLVKEISKRLGSTTQKEVENIFEKLSFFINKSTYPTSEINFVKLFNTISAVIINLNKEDWALWSQLTAHLDENKKDLANWIKETFYGKLEEIQNEFKLEEVQ
ncbi:hypothetical protein [Holospora obtusa]|nr:hypothetical protein [Holospora obtusa]